MRTDLDSGARAMARGAAVNLAGAAATNGLAFVLLYVTTHLVSVEGIGLLTVATTVVTLALVPAVLGLDTGVVRFVARGAALADERAARGALQAALAVVTLVSFLLSAVILWKAPWLATALHKPRALPLLRISVFSLPGLAIGRVALAAGQGFGVMVYAAWFGSLRVAINLTSAVALLAVGLGVRGLAWAAVITAWGTCGAALASLARVHPAAFRPAPDCWHTLKLLRFSLPQTLSGMLFFTILWTDTLLLARFRTAAEVGVYAVAGRLLTPATLISTAIGQMFAPRIAAADAQGNREVLARMLKRVTYWNTAVSLPFFAILALIPGPLLGLFGMRYERGALALGILALAQLINTAAGPLGQVINMSGRPYINMANNALVAAMNIGGCLVLIPRFGLTGAACSTAGALTLVNVIKLVEVRVLFGMYPFRGDSLRTFAAGALAVAIALPVVLVPPWPQGPFEAVVAAAVVFVGYLRLALKFVIRGEEREVFEKGWARIARLIHT